MILNSYKTLKTKCGQEFNKDLLKVMAFTTKNFKYSHTTHTIYKTESEVYIYCSHTYDAITDLITVDCEIISEYEALAYVSKTYSC